MLSLQTVYCFGCLAVAVLTPAAQHWCIGKSVMEWHLLTRPNSSAAYAYCHIWGNSDSQPKALTCLSLDLAIVTQAALSEQRPPAQTIWYGIASAEQHSTVLFGEALISKRLHVSDTGALQVVCHRHREVTKGRLGTLSSSLLSVDTACPKTESSCLVGDTPAAGRGSL